jgi:hypothetical protein
MAEMPAGPSPAPDDRRVVGLLVAAAAVALITVGLVLRFGLVSPPELRAVDDATRPTQAVAILAYRDTARGQCLDVVAPDGTVREVRCTLDGVGPLLGWDERGILVLRYSSFGERLEAIDPDTGAVVSSGAFDPREAELQRWSTSVDIERSGRTLIVRDERRQVLWTVEAPDGYWINVSARHPDTGAVALLDSAGRLLVLVPGEDAPRLWVEDVGQRYGELVWQGTPLTAD